MEAVCHVPLPPQRLNNYVDEMSHGRVPKSTTLEFFVRDGPAHRSVQAQLTPSGSLSPLFFAFGLISADELERGGGVSSASDTHFLSWLKDQVQEAVRTAEQHDMMKWRIRKLRAAFEEKYDLAAVQVRPAGGARSGRGGRAWPAAAQQRRATPALHGAC